jgi:hypothetical protein
MVSSEAEVEGHRVQNYAALWPGYRMETVAHRVDFMKSSCKILEDDLLI